MQSEQSEPNAHYAEYYIGFMVSMYAADHANKYQHPGVHFRQLISSFLVKALNMDRWNAATLSLPAKKKDEDKGQNPKK